MASIINHTTRAPGTVLTAAIYNQDHLVHINNAHAINDDVNLQHSIPIGLVIDGGQVGSSRYAPPTGIWGSLPVPFNCDIVGAFAFADAVGSAEVDLLYTLRDNLPPTDPDDSITSMTPIVLDSEQTYEDTTLEDWTTSLEEDGLLTFKLVSVTEPITRITVWINVRKK